MKPKYLFHSYQYFKFITFNISFLLNIFKLLYSNSFKGERKQTYTAIKIIKAC